MTPAPAYRWTVRDHRMTRSWQGEATARSEAQAAAVAQIARIGRGLVGVSATVFRPSGGGWFARDHGGRGNITWEQWEPVET
jgi:hypothetical protein